MLIVVFYLVNSVCDSIITSERINILYGYESNIVLKFQMWTKRSVTINNQGHESWLSHIITCISILIWFETCFVTYMFMYILRVISGTYILTRSYITASENLKSFFSTCKEGSARVIKISITDGKANFDGRAQVKTKLILNLSSNKIRTNYTERKFLKA